MISYQRATLDESTVEQLIELSKCWSKEECSFGMRPNTREDLQDACYIALDGDRIIGYIFGHPYIQEKKTSYIEIGSKCFDVDEIYVLPEYRDQGIGDHLFKLLEAEVTPEVDYITLATSTKDYSRILRFYTEGQGMTFHSAFLIKKCGQGC